VPNRQDLALRAVLRVLRPLVRLLLREGVTYPALASALKPVFVDAARDELDRQGMKPTASALSVTSGVHRKDLRAMADPSRARGDDGIALRLHLVAQVVARWLSGRGWHDQGRPKVLPRGDGARSFDALVAGVSRDVRAKAVLDEMLRLGVVTSTPDGIALVDAGLAPRKGFDAMSQALADNLHDHAAAAADNVAGDHNFLDQAIYVDELTEASVSTLRSDAVRAWQDAFARVMPALQARFDIDARDAPPEARTRRLRFGVYCYDAAMDDDVNPASAPAAPGPPSPSIRSPSAKSTRARGTRGRDAGTNTRQGRTR
jgi:hypothetical protein